MLTAFTSISISCGWISVGVGKLLMISFWAWPGARTATSEGEGEAIVKDDWKEDEDVRALRENTKRKEDGFGQDFKALIKRQAGMEFPSSPFRSAKPYDEDD